MTATLKCSRKGRSHRSQRATSASARTKAPAREKRKRCQYLPETPVEYVASVEFPKRNAEARILDHPAFDQALAERELDRGESQPESHLAKMCSARLLTPTEETVLFRAMNYLKYRAHRLQRRHKRPSEKVCHEFRSLTRQASQVRNRIIEANLRLVVSIVKRYASTSQVFDELLSEGTMSLMKAVDKFDYDRGFRFSTYATRAIVRNFGRHLKRSAQRRSRTESSPEVEYLENSLPAEPEEGLSEREVVRASAALEPLLARLKPREEVIVRARYGLNSDGETTTLQKLAGELGVCKERVRQLEHRALRKLREMADDTELREFDVT